MKFIYAINLQMKIAITERKQGNSKVFQYIMLYEEYEGRNDYSMKNNRLRHILIICATNLMKST